MSLHLIEPRNDLAALRTARDAYMETYSRLPQDGFTPTGNTPMLRLAMVSIATLHHAPIHRPVIPATRGLASEAAVQVVCIDAAGSRTAWSVAEELQSEFFGGRTRGFTRGLDVYRRIPRKGFDLIRGMDELDLVEWFCDVPAEDDWRRFETVRLKRALARLSRPIR